MSFWVVVAPSQLAVLHNMVIRVLGIEELRDGRFLWTVQAPSQVMKALAEAFCGELSVERCGYFGDQSPFD